jgi:3-hydroxybutyryl-CoA dehydrogenase
VRRVSVLGAGTMGHGIAQVCAMAGYDVRLADVSDELAHAGRERIRANLEDGVRRGKLAADAARACLGRVTVEANLEAACAGGDIIIEAVPERSGQLRQRRSSPRTHRV